jgi:hypothetical protein
LSFLGWFGRFLLFIHRCTLKQHYKTNIKDSNKIKQGPKDKIDFPKKGKKVKFIRLANQKTLFS